MMIYRYKIAVFQLYTCKDQSVWSIVLPPPVQGKYDISLPLLSRLKDSPWQAMKMF
jgi:hypothetical protein